MINVDDAEAKVNDIKRSLEAAEEELRLARNEQYKRVTNRPCPECGHLVGMGSMPSKEGVPDSRSVECQGCERRWDVQIVWNGGKPLEPANYKVEWTWRGWVFSEFPPSSLTNDQLQKAKEYLEGLGAGAVPGEKERLNALIFDQVRRMDARKLDDIRDTNISILELLKAKLGGQ